MQTEQVSFSLETEGKDAPAEIVKVDKSVIDIVKIERIVPRNEDSDLIGRIGFEIEGFTFYASIFDREDYIQGRFPGYVVDFNGIDSEIEREIKDSISAVAVDVWNIATLQYRKQEYNSYKNRVCSSCRYKQTVTFDSDEYNRRVYCQVRKILLDRGRQKVLEELNKDQSKWLMKEKGIIVTNPDWGAEGSLGATLNNLLDFQKTTTKCNYHRYAFMGDEGWYFQPLHHGHLDWDWKELNLETPKVIYKLRALNSAQETLVRLADMYDNKYEDINIEIADIGEIPEMEENQMIKALNELSEISTIPVNKIAELFDKAEFQATENDNNTDRFEKLKELCKQADLPMVEGETPFDNTLRVAENVEQIKNFVYSLEECEGMEEEFIEELTALFEDMQ